MFVRVAAFLMVTLLGAAIAAGQTVIYVRQGAPAGGDGTSWSRAYSNLDEALNDAANRQIGTVSIWMSAGVYTPSTRVYAADPRSATFNVRWAQPLAVTRRLEILGGFVGGESLVSQRQPALNRTILSGDLGGDDISAAELGPGAPLFSRPAGAINRDDNAYTIMRITGPGSGLRLDVTLDGLMFTGGYLDVNFGSPITDPRVTEFPGGSAIAQKCCADVTARGCWFIENGGPPRNNPDNGLRYFSSAWYMEVSSMTAVVEGCVFAGNYSGLTGGAISGQGNAMLVNSIFTGNSAEDSGGAVFNRGRIACDAGDQFRFTVTNCTFAGNRARLGGGGAYSSYCGFDSLTNCILWGNTSGVPQPERSQIDRELGLPRVGHSVVQGFTGSAATPFTPTAILSADPQFQASLGADGVAGTLDDDVRTSPFSIVVDAGLTSVDCNESTWAFGYDALPSVDIEGNARVFNGDVDDTEATVDIGPYELIDCPQDPTDVLWTGAAGNGLFATPGNWLRLVPWAPPPPPGPTGNALFRLRSAPGYDVGVSADATVGGLAVCNDRVRLNLGGRRLTLAGTRNPALVVGGGLVPTDLSVQVGTLSTPTLSIGPAHVGSGQLTVHGVGSRLNVEDAGVVGESFLGELFITGGGLVTADFLAFGGDSAALGRGMVDGSGGPTGATPSRMSVSSELSIGALGPGELTIKRGAQVSARNLSVGSELASGVLSLLDAGSRADIAFFTTIDRGELFLASGTSFSGGFGTFVFQNGELSGFGQISGPVVNLGTVSPGGDAVGTLSIAGGGASYAQYGDLPDLAGLAGVLRLQAAGLGAGQYDRLVVSGPVTLGGGLVLEWIGDFEPPPGAAIALDVLNGTLGSSGSGSPGFGVALFPQIEGRRYLRLQYGLRGPGSGATIVDAPLPSDIDYSSLPDDDTPINALPAAAATADLTGDARPDLVVTLRNSAPGAVRILINNGVQNGTWSGFGSSTLLPLPGLGSNPTAIETADLTGDGRADVVVATAGAPGESPRVWVYEQLASPAGTFALWGTSVVVGGQPVGLAFGDFDRDGSRLDAAVLCAGDATVHILGNRNTTPGLADLATIPVPDAAELTAVAGCNPDRDKDTDLIITDRGRNGVAILRNVTVSAGFPSFSVETLIQVGAEPIDVIAAPVSRSEFEDRSIDDIITVNAGDGSITVLVNRTPASGLPNESDFAAPVSLPVGQGVRAAAVADFGDSNGDLDIAVLTSTGASSAITVLRNDLSEAGLAFAQSQSLESSRSGLFVLAEDLDANGRPDIIAVTRDPLRQTSAYSETFSGLCPRAISDFNRSGAATVQDIYDFLAAWFAESTSPPPNPTTDVNGSRSVTTQDLFDFLAIWIEGCA